jgi:hypothetical protein
MRLSLEASESGALAKAMERMKALEEENVELREEVKGLKKERTSLRREKNTEINKLKRELKSLEQSISAGKTGAQE